MGTLVLALCLLSAQSIEKQVPREVLTEIENYAKKAKVNASTRTYLIQRGCESYLELKKYSNKEVASTTLFHIRAVAAKDHPGDYATQLYVVTREAEAAVEVRRFADPELSIGELSRFKAKVANDHPDSFTTQIRLLESGVGKPVAKRYVPRPRKNVGEPGFYQ